jgi:hypothetical protein
MRPILSASKVRGVSVYSGKVQTGHSWPTSVEDVGRRHKSHGGGTLRAGVFDVNDGLVSNTCGRRRGRAFRPHLDRRSRAAAGAFSMAAGEFISMLSQKEMFEHQIAQELWQRSSAWRLAHALDRHGGRWGDLRDRVAVQRRGALIGRPSLPDHWTTVINSAEFGTDYYTRTAVAKSNIFINRPRETRYFYQDLDKRGARLTGVERTFAEAPPVEGFWSITLYNQHHFFAPNELNRFSLGTKSKGLRLEGDGSLIIMCRPRARARTRSRTSCRRLPGSSPSISAPIGRFPRSARGAGRRPPWCRWVRARAGFTANRPGLSHARLSTRRGRDRMLNATFTVFSNTPGKFHGGDRP